MATYAKDKDLIQRVQTAAARMGVAAKWSTGKRLKLEDDFLLELYVLFRFLNGLDKQRFKVVYCKGKSPNEHCFPQNPASKSNGWAYFEIHEKCTVAGQIVPKKLFQVCAGTQVENIFGQDKAPDISLQKANASDSPKFGDLVLILDAKYRKSTSNNQKITDAEFAKFALWMSDFDLDGKPAEKLVFNYSGYLNACCLVTNGHQSGTVDKACTAKGIREVTQFHPTRKSVYRP